MKKCVFIVLLFTLPLCVLFSQTRRETITFNTWAFAIFEPIKYTKLNGEDPRFSAGIGGTEETQPHMDLRVNYLSPNGIFGGSVETALVRSGNSLTPAVGDNATIWIKPFSWIRLNFGKFWIDTLRGSIGASDFARYLGPQGDQDTTFQRFTGRNGGGALLSITPTKNLFIGALININTTMRTYDNFTNDSQDAGVIYRNGQYAVAYTFQDTGRLAVQYIGGEADVQRVSTSVNSSNVPTTPYLYRLFYMNIYNAYGLNNPRSLQAAFSLTAIKNIKFEMNFLYPLPVEKSGVQLQRPVGLGLGIDYTFEDFNITGRTDFSFLGREKRDLNTAGHTLPSSQATLYRDFSISTRLTPSYDFFFARFGMDFLVNYKTATRCNLDDYTFNDDGLHLGVALWVMKRFSPGTIQFGITIAMPTKWQEIADSDNLVTNKTIKAPLVITVPLLVSFYL